jgi:hypothetical protein
MCFRTLACVRERALRHSSAYGAAGLALVPTVAEPAGCREIRDVTEDVLEATRAVNSTKSAG